MAARVSLTSVRPSLFRGLSLLSSKWSGPLAWILRVVRVSGAAR